MRSFRSVAILKSVECSYIGSHRRISVVTTASIEFGVIPHDHWFQPSWINEEEAKAGRDKMAADGVIYGGALCAIQHFLMLMSVP